MAIINRQGKVAFFATFAEFAEAFGADTVTKVQVWDFERAPICELCVSSDKAHGSIVLAHGSTTAAAMVHQQGWPTAKIWGRPLPHASALMYEHLWAAPPAPDAPTEPATELQHISPRVHRVRRVRASA